VLSYKQDQRLSVKFKDLFF